jgi:cytochrome c oxidase assembly factor CtaG
VALPPPADLDLSPVSLAALAAMGAVSWRLLRRARLGLDAAELRRRVLMATGGMVLLAIGLVSPVATLAGHYLLTAHLVQATLVMGFAPPLLLLGLPPVLAIRPRLLRFLARAAVHPACSIVLVNVVFFGWHAPVLYDAALQHPPLYALQQLMLFAVSLAFWWSIVEPTGPGPWSMGGLLKLGYILLATIPQTFAGLLFALAHHVFYAPYAAAPRVTGLDALGDQQLAGALMAILSKLALFAAFSVVLWHVLDAHGEDDERGDDDGGRGRDDDPRPVPPNSPAWLDLLHRGRTVPEPAPRGGRAPVPALLYGSTPQPHEPAAPARPSAPQRPGEPTPALMSRGPQPARR